MNMHKVRKLPKSLFNVASEVRKLSPTYYIIVTLQLVCASVGRGVNQSWCLADRLMAEVLFGWLFRDNKSSMYEKVRAIPLASLKGKEF